MSCKSFSNKTAAITTRRQSWFFKNQFQRKQQLSDEPPWESTKVCSSAPPKADDGRILCPCFWEVNPLWNIGAGEPGDGEGIAKVKTNLWRKDRFYCKRNFKRCSGDTNAILIFCLIWCWILFQEGFTIGQLLDEVKKGNHFYIEAMKEDHLYLEVRK